MLQWNCIVLYLCINIAFLAVTPIRSAEYQTQDYLIHIKQASN